MQTVYFLLNLETKIKSLHSLHWKIFCRLKLSKKVSKNAFHEVTRQIIIYIIAFFVKDCNFSIREHHWSVNVKRMCRKENSVFKKKIDLQMLNACQSIKQFCIDRCDEIAINFQASTSKQLPVWPSIQC
jgi:hypothetical protein